MQGSIEIDGDSIAYRREIDGAEYSLRLHLRRWTEAYGCDADNRRGVNTCFVDVAWRRKKFPELGSTARDLFIADVPSEVELIDLWVEEG